MSQLPLSLFWATVDFSLLKSKVSKEWLVLPHSSPASLLCSWFSYPDYLGSVLWKGLLITLILPPWSLVIWDSFTVVFTGIYCEEICLLLELNSILCVFWQELIFSMEGFKSYGWYLTLVQFAFYSIFGLIELQLIQDKRRRYVVCFYILTIKLTTSS